MRRLSLMVMMWAALAMPMLAMADGQSIPPETNWTPTPPARSIIDVNRLAGLLVDKGMITAYEYTQLAQTRASSSASPHRRTRQWTWEEINYNPVRNTGGD